MMKYKYFVSYTFTKGTGCTVLETDKKVKKFKDILNFKEAIEKSNKDTECVVILNIQRLPI